MLRLLSISLLLIAPFTGGREAAFQPRPLEGLMGLDVSHHQEKIEWDTVVHKQTIDFAFVKATEGSDFIDSLFQQNWESLGRLGVRRGAYHFFRAYGCGDDQARLFLQTVQMKPGDIAPVLDIELTDGIDPEVMIQEAKIWLQVVEAELKVRPIIYSNQNFYDKYLADAFKDHPIWIARYSSAMPILENGQNWAIWQYSNEGCVDGICKTVDLNLFSGTPAMLDRLCWYPQTVEASIAEP